MQGRSIQAKIAADMEAPPGPLRSPDGLWWWDGKGWQPIATLAAPRPPVPPPPPAVMPAKDEDPPGGAWQPPAQSSQPPAGGWQPTQQPPAPSPPAVSPPEPASPAHAAPSAPPQPEVPWPGWLPHSERTDAIVQEAPSRTRATTPPPAASAPPVAPPGPSSEVPASSWVARLYPARVGLTSNRQLVTYGGLGVLGLIALFVVFQVLSQVNLFGASGNSTPVEAAPTGTQFQQADRFLSGSLNPALESVTFNATQIPTDCGGTHSVTCQSTLENADTAFLKAIAVIDKGPFPSCLAAPVVQMRHDLVNLDQAIKAALIGFKGNDSLVTKGLADFKALAASVKANSDALRAAEQASCPKSP